MMVIESIKHNQFSKIELRAILKEIADTIK